MKRFLITLVALTACPLFIQAQKPVPPTFAFELVPNPSWSFADAVRIDKADDNIWAVDKGSDTIVKFNQEGHVVWVSMANCQSCRKDV